VSVSGCIHTHPSCANGAGKAVTLSTVTVTFWRQFALFHPFCCLTKKLNLRSARIIHENSISARVFEEFLRLLLWNEYPTVAYDCLSYFFYDWRISFDQMSVRWSVFSCSLVPAARSVYYSIYGPENYFEWYIEIIFEWNWDYTFFFELYFFFRNRTTLNETFSFLALKCFEWCIKIVIA